MPREVSVFSLLNFYLELELKFKDIEKTNKSRYANVNDTKLVYLGPIALFNNFRLTTSSGKHSEDISQARIVFLMYKQITRAKETDGSSIGLDRNRNRRQQEWTNNKNTKGKYHVRILLKDVFRFTEHQEKATFGLGYKLTLTRNKDDAVWNKAEPIADEKVKIDHTHWYVPNYTQSIP